jgi:hypothetical protein
MPPYEEKCPNCGAILSLDTKAMMKRIAAESGRPKERMSFDQIDQETVEIECIVKRQTEKAIFIETEDEIEDWVPKSQIQDWDENDSRPSSILIPMWLAKKKGFLV